MCRDGIIRFIYVHHNAYPECLGRLLVQCYSTYDKVMALVRGGDCSVVGATLSECQAYSTLYRSTDKGREDFFGKLSRDIEAVYLFQPDFQPTSGKPEEWPELNDSEEDTDADSEEDASADSTKTDDRTSVSTAPVAEKGNWLVKTGHIVNLTMFS